MGHYMAMMDWMEQIEQTLLDPTLSPKDRLRLEQELRAKRRIWLRHKKRQEARQRRRARRRQGR